MPYINQSPWNAGNDIGETFSRMMMGMAQLKQQQASQGMEAAQFNARMQMQAEQNAMQQQVQEALRVQKQPLIDAQVGAQKATEGFNTARMDSTKAQASNAQDAGLAGMFDSLNTQGLPVNPTTGGSFPATPENIKMLTSALLKQHLTQAAAGSPAAAATLLKPERNYTLTPGAQMFGPEGGEPLATNMIERGQVTEADKLSALVSALRGAGDMVTSLGTDKTGMGELPYQQNPQLGQTFTNAMDIVNLLSDKLKTRFTPTNAPSATAPPAAGGMPTVKTKEEWAKLSPGQKYIDPDGNIATKK